MKGKNVSDSIEKQIILNDFNASLRNDTRLSSFSLLPAFDGISLAIVQ